MSVVTSHSEIMHGTPCFAGTRVPASILFDYLVEGNGIDDFLRQYPTISREKVISLIEQCRQHADATAVRLTD